MINPPIYRLTTAVSDIDQTNINRDIRDGNRLSNYILYYQQEQKTPWNFQTKKNLHGAQGRRLPVQGVFGAS